MKFKTIRSVIILAAVTLISIDSHAFLLKSLNCKASEPTTVLMPGRSNSREIQLVLRVDDFVGGHGFEGYKEYQHYDGGYPVSDWGIGIVKDTEALGNTIKFKMKRLADLSESNGLPMWRTARSYRTTDASYDLKKNELTIDVSNRPWYFQSASVLSCIEK